jgi:hypothetical protein
MLPFGVTIPTTIPQRSEIPEGLMNYPVYEQHLCRYQILLLFLCWNCFSFTSKMHSAVAVKCVQQFRGQDISFQTPFRGATGNYVSLCYLIQYNFSALSKNSEISTGHPVVEMTVPTFQISLYFWKWRRLLICLLVSISYWDNSGALKTSPAENLSLFQSFIVHWLVHVLLGLTLETLRFFSHVTFTWSAWFLKQKPLLQHAALFDWSS